MTLSLPSPRRHGWSLGLITFLYLSALRVDAASPSAPILPQPPYPAEALEQKLEGRLTVAVRFDDQGRVDSCRVVQSSDLVRGIDGRAAPAKTVRFNEFAIGEFPMGKTYMTTTGGGMFQGARRIPTNGLIGFDQLASVVTIIDTSSDTAYLARGPKSWSAIRFSP